MIYSCKGTLSNSYYGIKRAWITLMILSNARSDNIPNEKPYAIYIC